MSGSERGSQKPRNPLVTAWRKPCCMFSMLKLALLVPVVFALGSAGNPVTGEGAAPVSLRKKAMAYPVKCSAPIKVTAVGPGSLVIDVRGKADAIDKPLEM